MLNRHRFIRPLIASFSLAFTASAMAEIRYVAPPEDQRMWAFEFGVAFITENNIEDILNGEFSYGEGDSGGEIYSLTASRFLGELEWKAGSCVFRPQMEMPLTLEIFDENGRDPFPDVNASFLMRWVDFPWNDIITTTFGMGVGLSYSAKVPLMDQERHEDERRSKLKFNWPIQLTFAAPAYPDHQLTLFLSHQSGGHIFDRGGMNSLGFGYRRGF